MPIRVRINERARRGGPRGKNLGDDLQWALVGKIRDLGFPGSVFSLRPVWFVPMRILVTAGNTLVPIDRVRCITNIFTGRTGARIALHAQERGHDVTLL